MLSPLYGSGIIPASGAVADELTAVTRRAFVPKLIVQIYQSTPLMQALMDNAQFASGGLDPITVPVQGAQMVNAQWSGYSGSFDQPGQQPGITNAQATLKLAVVPIPFLGMEGAVQLSHAVIPLIEARLNDATTVLKQTFATAIFSNTAAVNAQALTGIPDAVDDGTNTDTYMGISRAANAFWKAKYTAAGSVDPTRNLIMQYISTIVKACGEMPTMGVTGFGTWTKLTQDFTSLEQYNHTPASGGFNMVQSMFNALEVAGVPIYPDPFCPEGTLTFFNTNYFNLYVHDAASFAFSGFHSTIPNFQIGFIGVLATILELVNAKPISSYRITGLNFLNI